MKNHEKYFNAHKNPIDLEPIEIDVELDVNPIEKPARAYSSQNNVAAAIHYRDLLDQLIQSTLVSRLSPTLSQIQQLRQVQKQQISYISALNLDYVQKLRFLSMKCSEHALALINIEIADWERIIINSMIDTSEETYKFAQFEKLRQIQKQENTKNMTNMIIVDMIDESQERKMRKVGENKRKQKEKSKQSQGNRATRSKNQAKNQQVAVVSRSSRMASKQKRKSFVNGEDEIEIDIVDDSLYNVMDD